MENCDNGFNKFYFAAYINYTREKEPLKCLSQKVPYTTPVKFYESRILNIKEEMTITMYQHLINARIESDFYEV